MAETVLKHETVHEVADDSTQQKQQESSGSKKSTDELIGDRDS